jgi:nucleoside-diphosphate-sugar epimerase
VAILSASVASAFVTGGSGFIGRRLIRRLVAEGYSVRALARSDRSAALVAEAGAEAVRGDLTDAASLREGARGCELAFHAAAEVNDWGDREHFERTNVQGTKYVIAACRAEGVRRLVHVGTEAALMVGQPLVNVDETEPLRPDSPVLYCSTKAKAEQAVRDANGDGLETVVVRPRFVWGPDDTVLLPNLIELVKKGRFSWIGGGGHLTATAHVDNVVEGLWLGATRGAPGGVYFVTDGEPIAFREMVTRMLATAGVDAPDKNVPAPVARAGAAACETLWRLLPLRGHPPITRFAVWVSSLECTIDISRARSELGYEPLQARDEGLAELG